METLKFEDFKYVNAGPTCGKSTYAAHINKSKLLLLDTDVLIFGWAMTHDDIDNIKSLSEKLKVTAPWHGGPPLQSALWDVVTNGALMYANLVAAKFPEISIISNLGLQGKNKIAKRSLTVFRRPEDIVKMAEIRARAKDKKYLIPLDLAQKWFKSWEKYNSYYGKAVVLEEGQYISDLFGVKPEITDSNQVDAINYGRVIDWAKAENLDLYLPFESK